MSYWHNHYMGVGGRVWGLPLLRCTNEVLVESLIFTLCPYLLNQKLSANMIFCFHILIGARLKPSLIRWKNFTLTGVVWGPHN